MKPMLYGLLAGCMGIGAYALVDATMKERAAAAAQAEHVAHCDRANALMLAEFDAIVGAGKFPTQAQQDYWVGLTAGCGEELTIQQGASGWRYAWKIIGQ